MFVSDFRKSLGIKLRRNRKAVFNIKKTKIDLTKVKAVKIGNKLYQLGDANEIIEDRELKFCEAQVLKMIDEKKVELIFAE